MTQDRAWGGVSGVLLALPRQLLDVNSRYCWWEKCQGWTCQPPAPTPPSPAGLWGCWRGTPQNASSTLAVAGSADAAWKVEGKDLMPISPRGP